MSGKTKQLLEQALALSEEERAQLVEWLQESLNGDFDPAVADAWEEEIGRRIEDLDSGKVKPVPWDDAQRQMFGTLDDDD